MRHKDFKKQVSVFLVVISLFALLSIGATTPSCNNKNTGPAFNTTALTISFVDQAPPAQINVGTPFQIYVRAENNGGYDVSPGTARFYITGIGNVLRNVNSIVSNQNLINKETPQQEAGFEIIKFAENAEPSIVINSPFNLTTMKVDACYTYATQTQASVCIGQGDSMCPLTGEKITTGSNSNAPLQITSITEQVQGNKLYIAFMIHNKGTGDVYYSDFDCDKFYGQDSSERNKQLMKKNYVEISIDAPTESDLKCNLMTPAGSPASGNTGMAPVGTKVTCSKTIGQGTTSAPLNINMAYKYDNSITKFMTILP
jgi:hypothetical protein